MNSDSGEGWGQRQGLENRYSRLRCQQAIEEGRAMQPAPPPAVPWHHRAGPIGGGLGIPIQSAQERLRLLAAMPRILMPGEAIPPY